MLNNLMEAVNQPTSKNDYAVAKALNEEVMAIIYSIIVAGRFDSHDKFEINELNRAYILLVDELQKLYDRNPELAAIKPEPVWKHFDVLRTATWEIDQYAEEVSTDELNAHVARIEKLCIISGKETPDLSAKQTKLVDDAKTARSKYIKAVNKIDAENKVKKGNDDKLTLQNPQENGLHIAKLSLVQKTLKLNVGGVTRTLKHFDSTKRFNYNLTKFLLDRPDEWIKKEDLGTAFKTIGSKVKDWPKLMGLTGELKDIFISVNTKEQKIMLNPSKSLSPDEAEILQRLVNTSKPQ